MLQLRELLKCISFSPMIYDSEKGETTEYGANFGTAVVFLKLRVPKYFSSPMGEIVNYGKPNPKGIFGKKIDDSMQTLQH